MGAEQSEWEAAWEQASVLVPRLVRHARFLPHRYRGEEWTVVEDATSGRQHRLGPDSSRAIEQMDGVRSLAEIREALVAELGPEAAPSPAELLRLVTQLQTAGPLLTDVPVDAEAVCERAELGRRQLAKYRWLSPLALRVPLYDPTPLLQRGLPFLRPLFSRTGAIVWSVHVAAALLLAGMHTPELLEHARERALAPNNLVVLWLLFPVVKILHEFGHAFATRIWGGAVREMGITLLVLTPVPYVDASAATAFPAKGRRMLVGAAGVMVELLLAAWALWLWVALEPGLLRDAAFDVVLIGTVSTLVFNGNPLLRFDAYYVLADVLEIPNLGPRSIRYLGYLVQRYAFGLEDARSPVTARGERSWLLAYGVASSLYKLLIVFLIAAFLASRFFVIGVVLALWALLAQLVVPALRHLGFVLRDPRLRGRRGRAVAASGGVLLLCVGFLLLAPVPSSTVAEGVVRLPEQSLVRAGSDAFVLRLVAEEGSLVRVGDPLIETDDPELRMRVPALEWQLRELETRRIGTLLDDRVAAQILQDEIAKVRAELSEAMRRVKDLVIASPAAGRFVVPGAQHLPGRFARQGETLGYVIGSGAATARVVVPESEIGPVRAQTRAVRVRLAQHPGLVLPARIEREVPSASDRLPSQALGTRGGGAVEVDARDEAGLRTRSPLFQLDLALPDRGQPYFAGGRVQVLFEHVPEALGQRWYRRLRQLFLARFQA